MRGSHRFISAQCNSSEADARYMRFRPKLAHQIEKCFNDFLPTCASNLRLFHSLPLTRYFHRIIFAFHFVRDHSKIHRPCCPCVPRWLRVPLNPQLSDFSRVLYPDPPFSGEGT